MASFSQVKFKMNLNMSSTLNDTFAKLSLRHPGNNVLSNGDRLSLILSVPRFGWPEKTPDISYTVSWTNFFLIGKLIYRDAFQLHQPTLQSERNAPTHYFL